MKYVKFFDTFKKELDYSLNKIYLVIRSSSNHAFWSYKGFATDNFFIKIDENNYNKININKKFPILNYSNILTDRLIKNKKIIQANIYNHPKYIHLSGSKKDFHNYIGDDVNLPKTVFSINDVNQLKFPIIAKPSKGHSGIGIKLISKESDIKNINPRDYDLYSEYIDKREEMRFFAFKGKPIFWMERNPLNAKSKNGFGSKDAEMKFSYTRKKIEKIPADYLQVLKKYCKLYQNIQFICFDMIKDKNNNIYVLESNAQPGVPFDSTAIIYESIFRDFYKRPLDKNSKMSLDYFSKFMIDKTLSIDSNRFFID